MSSAPVLHHSDMVSPYFSLGIGITVFRVPQAVIPAGNIALSILDFSDEILIIDNQICHHAIRKSTFTTMYIAAGALQILQNVSRFHVFVGMFIHHRLSFKGCQRGFIEHFLFRTFYLIDFIGVLSSELHAPIILYACPCDRDIPAYEESFRGLRQML